MRAASALTMELTGRPRAVPERERIVLLDVIEALDGIKPMATRNPAGKRYSIAVTAENTSEVHARSQAVGGAAPTPVGPFSFST